MQQRVDDGANSVEELAMNGWVRGGTLTRNMSADDDFKKNNRPSTTY
jgi:hypothetical protein